jgi:small subunit ribosomal protein S1
MEEKQISEAEASEEGEIERPVNNHSMAASMEEEQAAQAPAAEEREAEPSGDEQPMAASMEEEQAAEVPAAEEGEAEPSGDEQPMAASAEEEQAAEVPAAEEGEAEPSGDEQPMAASAEEEQVAEVPAAEEGEAEPSGDEQPMAASAEEEQVAEAPAGEEKEAEPASEAQPMAASMEEEQVAQAPAAEEGEAEPASETQPTAASVEEEQVTEAPASEEKEAEPASEEQSMDALMQQALSFQRLKQGDIVEGEIVSVTPTEVLVHVGAKSEGIVPGKELERLGRQGLEDLKPGDPLLVYVVRPEDREGNLILSIRRAEEERDWRYAEKLYESGDVFEGQIAGFNRGGLIVRLGRLRGFIPASQLSPEHQGSDKQQPEERWARLVGVTTQVKVIEFNRKRKRLILSERAAVRQWRESQKEKLLQSLRVGEVRQGTVSSLTDFGAFIDLGGADGLVHLSELSWNRSTKPRDVLKVGQKVDVYVLNVDQERKRIALSLKRLQPEPWTTVESRYYVGQLVEGTITRLTNFGAFALVNDEIEGLIHISELSNGRINHPSDVIHEGEKHVMRIIRIDPKRRRMGLSLKRVADPAYADLDWRAELAEQNQSFEYEGVDAGAVTDDDLSDYDEGT